MESNLTCDEVNKVGEDKNVPLSPVPLLQISECSVLDNMTPLESPVTPLSAGTTPKASPGCELTPKKLSNSVSAMESLFSAPLKLTEVDQLTPGQENTILGKAIQRLGINSPMTPRSSKVARNRDTALTPVNIKKRSRQISLDECAMENDEPCLKKACTTPKNNENSDSDGFCPKPKFFRSQSESGVTRNIKYAMEQKENNPLLIGDCSRHYTLPLVSNGRHQDLKEITAQTLAELLDGKYSVNYAVIDCRYPYEFSGGHVRGAVNLYTESQVYKNYFDERNRIKGSDDPEILIFHCEFSMERGPKMCRVVRDWDRNANMNSFPSLFYPEMYVLHRGYKGFYEDHPSYCEPSKYVKMIEDPDQLRVYQQQCKTELFRTKSKSVPSRLGSGRSSSIKKLLM